jgi:electron transfer flavoprotein beta subunit
VAHALRRVVDEVEPDLVLMGKQAVDGDSNQVGQFLAELLDWPMATFAATIAEQENALLVEREVDGGVARVRVGLPAVVTVDLRIVAPSSVWSRHTDRSHVYGDGVRFAPLLAVRQAQRKPLEVRPLTSVTDQPLTTRYLRFVEPPRRARGVRVESVDELVARLATEAKVI